MAQLKGRPCWWDTERDRAGRVIRADVRAAAHEIWERARSRTNSVLGDSAEAAELMEYSVERISGYLERARAPLGSQSTAGLLMVTFHGALLRYAAKVKRLETVGGTNELSERLPDDGWAKQIDARLDLEKVVRTLTDRSRTILALRDAGYEWKEVAQMLGITVSAAKNGFLRDVRRAKSKFLKESLREDIGPTQQ